MHAFRESASGEAVLVVGVNWLGDSVMTMPAIQAWRRVNPRVRLAVLVKPKCRDIWSMHADVDEVLVCREGALGSIRAAGELRKRGFSKAFVLPHSFRSALAPFLAWIPSRVGMPGHGRDWMLTRVVKPDRVQGREHQSYEYMSLFGVSDVEPEFPALTVPRDVVDRVSARIGGGRPVRIGLVPGAAHGPSKRWPAEYFAQAGRMLCESLNCGVLVFGSADERELCGIVARGIGREASDLSGQTALPELAAALSMCSVVITNDSGGMHLAAALGAPVVAVFGITDPVATGPLGRCVCVLQDSALRSRDLERESEIGEASLRRISPERVYDAARELIGKR